MIIIGIVYGILTGHVAAVTNVAIVSPKEAVNLCIAMQGIMAGYVEWIKGDCYTG